jgi:mevalonate pyrophosphate decarboxylase
MGRKPSPTPTYRRHSPRNLAFVEIRGKRTYLGRYGSPESKAAYANIVLELSAGEKNAQTPAAVAEVAPLSSTRQPGRAFRACC